MVRLGIIGMGYIGTIHSQIIMSGDTPEVKLTAVSDSSESRCDWAKENLPGVHVFKDAEELLRSKTCDAVIIASPHYLHPEIAIKAFESGVHVLCEKPAGVYTKQVREMNEAAKKSGLVFAMMLSLRTNYIYRYMKDLVSSGELGAIKRVYWIATDWYRTQYYYDSGTWRATWKGEGGGALLNQCSHNLDILQWICGMPDKMHAFCHEGKWHDIEVEDDVTAYFEYPNGATGFFVTSTGDAPGENRFVITLEKGTLICEKGTLTLHELSQNERDFCKTAKESMIKPECKTSIVESASLSTENRDQYIRIINSFAAAILHGTPLIANGEEGINSLMLSNAMNLSSWLNKTIEIPFDEDLYLSELNKRCES